MNRYRINQILSVLLFPFCDPELGEKDWLLQKTIEYEKFRKYNGDDLKSMAAREDQFGKYRHACSNLQHYLEKRNEGRIKSYDDLMQLCEHYYSMQELLKKLQEYDTAEKVCGTWREQIAVFYYEKLEKVAKSLITYRDGVAAIRTWNVKDPDKEDLFAAPQVFDKVEIWSLLCRFTVPDIYIASFAVQCGLEIEVLYGQNAFISLADKLLVKSLRKGIAENHLHFNVGFDYTTIWLHNVNPSVLYKNLCVDVEEIMNWKEKARIGQAAIFRCCAAMFLIKEQDSGDDFFSWLRKKTVIENREEMVSVLMDMDRGRVSEREKLRNSLGELEKLLDSTDSDIGYDFLLKTIYGEYRELRTSSEFILLYFCCRYINRHKWDTKFAHLFLQYLRIKNNLFYSRQQRYEVKGLRYFQKYYRASSQALQLAGEEDVMLEVFRSQAKITALKKLEIRISPAVEKGDMDCFRIDECRSYIREQLCDQLRKIFYVYRRYILETLIGVQKTGALLVAEGREKRELGFSYCDLYEKVENLLRGETTVTVPTLGIVYHFIKMELLDNMTGYFCWKKIREDLIKYSKHSLIMRQHMANVAIVIEELRQKIPKLSEYIVGIDAASDENAMEPWMFAPAYTQMRSHLVAQPVAVHNALRQKYYSIQNIGFTYHVGEDFRHVISGLRHIDEVIDHFRYKPGDRLGHAIVLGIDIRKWVNENEVVALPLQEYMENLLWMWGKDVYDGINLPIQLEKLEERILKVVEEIGMRTEGMTVRMLYDAYQKKFYYDHKKIMEDECNEENQEEKDKSLFCRYSGKNGVIQSGGWTSNRLLCTNYCPVFEEKYRKVKLIRVSADEIEAYEMLQEYLLKKVETKGIFVETNPTSNLTIGDFNDFCEHPIFRMNAVKRGEGSEHHLMVTINSDDPAVFQTNVENELAYVYYATEHNGYAKEDVLEWIDKIRQNGLDASFIQQEKGSMQMLQELSLILDALR